MEQNNKIKVYTSSLGGNLTISVSGMKQTIEATNNRARYYAEQSLKYRDEAKKFAENAQYYAEQNADISTDDLINLKAELLREIETKQDTGDYALREELPVNITELNNDANYVNQTQLLEKVPEQTGHSGKVLTTDGQKSSWVDINTYKLFDYKLSDHILSYEESKGWALQGTYVYKEAIAGSRYGYPNFYTKCLEEYNEASTTETVNGITVKVHSNGHKFYDIANKTAIDEFYNTMGSAWFYGIDTELERVFLPRNNFFEQMTGNISEVGQSVEAGLPNITGSTSVTRYKSGTNASGCFTEGENTSERAQGDSGGSWYARPSYFDASLSSSIYKDNVATVQPNAVKKLLYICVGNITNYEGVTVVVNQGVEILEQVNQGIESRIKLDGSNAEFPHITETYINGTSWYRIWSPDSTGKRWCEQGGIVGSDTGEYGTMTVNLLKSFKDTDYTLIASAETTVVGDFTNTVNCSIRVATFLGAAHYSKTKNSFDCTIRNKINWQACGYLE